jgi:L-lactate dehydrogenase (cytochrome)/(S)-mandelate dehydrogenase
VVLPGRAAEVRSINVALDLVTGSAMNLSSVINLDDLRRLARRQLPRIAFDFIEGGADDERCLARNRDAFERYRLLPRYLRDVSQRDQSVELFGRTYASPIGISPTGLAGLFRPDADLMLAAAAREANVPFLLSSAANAALEDAMPVAPEHVWFQMYCTSDERINADLVQRARVAGVRVLVVSVDVPVNSNRERNRRNGFSRPFRMTPAVVLEALGHPAWVLRYLRTGGIPMMRNWMPYARQGASAAEVADLYGTLTPAPMVSWDHLQRIRQAWDGPLVIKGLLHPDDAREAVRLGADGVIVSNHGGRQLDAAPSPLEMLPLIRAAVGERVQIMLDSGVRRGSDIVIARCLGADSAIFGRPTLYGVAVAGQAGAARALQLMRNEVDMVLAQIGCRSFRSLDSGYLWPAPASRAQESGWCKSSICETADPGTENAAQRSS